MSHKPAISKSICLRIKSLRSCRSLYCPLLEMQLARHSPRWRHGVGGGPDVVTAQMTIGLRNLLPDLVRPVVDRTSALDQRQTRRRIRLAGFLARRRHASRISCARAFCQRDLELRIALVSLFEVQTESRNQVGARNQHVAVDNFADRSLLGTRRLAALALFSANRYGS